MHDRILSGGDIYMQGKMTCNKYHLYKRCPQASAYSLTRSILPSSISVIVDCLFALLLASIYVINSEYVTKPDVRVVFSRQRI